MSYALDSATIAGPVRIAAISLQEVSAQEFPGGAGLFARKSPVAVLVVQDERITVFDLSFTGVTLERLMDVCPALVEQFTNEAA